MKKNPPAPVARELDPHTLDRETFGRRLRTARKHFGWTLAQLAERSGVSITTISRAERGQLALGYENFAALGRALQMDMNAMFAADGVKTARLAGPVVTRSGEGTVYRSLSLSYEFLGTTAEGKLMSPVVGTVHARSIPAPADYARHAGEEFIFVLSGEIDVHMDTGDVIRLGRGDSLYFDSRIGHAYVSVSRQLAKVVGVVSNESSFMRFARQRPGDWESGGTPAAPTAPAPAATTAPKSMKPMKSTKSTKATKAATAPAQVPAASARRLRAGG